MNAYSTHQQALVRAVMQTDGPVLELGSGDYSTPILHEICEAQSRDLYTADSDLKFLNRFTHLATPRHRLSHVPAWRDHDWSTWLAVPWSVVFIDHAPAARRAVDIRAFANLAEYVVIHDTNDDKIHRSVYGLDSVLPVFKYRRDFTSYSPHTTIVSNKREP